MASESADEVWASGSVADAVAAVRAERSLLVVLTCAPEAKSSNDADSVLASASTRGLLTTTFVDGVVREALKSLRATCIKLVANETDSDFVAFRALFPAKYAPAVHIIAPDGRVLVHVSFFISPAALVRALAYAEQARDDPAQGPVPDLGPALHPRRPLPPSRAARAPQRPRGKAPTRAEAKPASKRAPAAASSAAASPGSTTASGGTRSTARAMQLGPPKARLAARLPDGRLVQRSFAPDAALHAALEWVAEELACRQDEVRLAVQFPRRVFDGGDTPKTMEELGLVPSATLIVVKEESASAGSGVLARVQSGGGMIRDAVGVAGSFFTSFVAGPQPPREGDEGGEDAGQGR